MGGIVENPGVVGHGGGIKQCEYCSRCGCRRDTNTWAQDPEDGSQGHTVIGYTPIAENECPEDVYEWLSRAETEDYCEHERED